MNRDKLKLVLPGGGAHASGEEAAEVISVPATPDPEAPTLRLVEADDGSSPDDAA